MSLLQTVKAAFGLSPTPSKNFTAGAKGDGSFAISRGNPGAETGDVMTIGADDKVRFKGGSLGGQQLFPVDAAVAGNALTLTLNPTALEFRSATLTSGAANLRFVDAALSLVIQAGATLGTASGQAARLAVLALDNAGTVELAVVNTAGGVNLDETTLASTTAISAAATSASTIYSATARSNVPFRVVGLIDITEAAAGTWASAPTRVQPAGGQALGAMASLGYGQTLLDVKASRALGVTYYNTTGKPIMLFVNTGSTTNLAYAQLTINGVTVYGSAVSTSTTSFVCGIVPPGGSYSVNTAATGSIFNWSELR